MPLLPMLVPTRVSHRRPARRRHVALIVLALVALISGTGGSLAADTEPQAPAASTVPQPVGDMLRVLWADARGNLLASARLVEEGHYDHRPRPELRSFGELVAHVVDTQYFFCSSARNEPNPNEPNHRPGVVASESLEATLEDKEAIVAAAERVVTYCDEVYRSASDATLGEQLEVGMQGQARIRPLLLGLYHMAGHYGNMTIYLRELGYVPPSSVSRQEPGASR